jgi:hypothetical protein
MRWRSGSIASDRAALLLAATSAASLGVYSLLGQELSAVIALALVLWALVVFAAAKYTLRVFERDRSPGDKLLSRQAPTERL